jgi:hypothetical protein
VQAFVLHYKSPVLDPSLRRMATAAFINPHDPP